MARQRFALGAAGILLGLYGGLRLVSQNSLTDLFFIGVWLVGAVAVHDGLVSPAVLVVGRALTRIPPQARRYLQSALLVGALVTVIALTLIYREDSQPASKALLVNDYRPRLGVLLAGIAVVSLVGYAVQVARSWPRDAPKDRRHC